MICTPKKCMYYTLNECIYVYMYKYIHTHFFPHVTCFYINF
jgi:hypothetical protein